MAAVVVAEAAVKRALSGEVLPLTFLQFLVVRGAALGVGEAAIGVLHLAQPLRQLGAGRGKIRMMTFGKAHEGGPKLDR